MERDLSKITDLDSMAAHFGCLKAYIYKYFKSVDQKSYYRELYIRKRNTSSAVGQIRIVFDAKDDYLKNLHKTIDEYLKCNEFYRNLPDYVQAFVPKRSIKTNAKKHLNKKIILKVDIKSFFDTIRFDDVVNVFNKLGCNEKISHILAKICTVDNVLCQGLNTSPTISNYVCEKMDKELDLLSKKYNCVYSRYCDDITFSSDDVLPTLDEVKFIFKKYGYEMNERKTKIQSRGHSQYVTGLSISDNLYPRVPKRMKRNLRLILYYINKFGIDGHNENIEGSSHEFIFDWTLSGIISYVNSIEPEFIKKHKKYIP